MVRPHAKAETLCSVFAQQHAHCPSSHHSTPGQSLGSETQNPVCKDCCRNEQVSDHTLLNEADFNDFLVYINTERAAPYFRYWIRRLFRDDHRIVLTHGDLHRGNNMEDVADGRVNVSLIDWEMGGFYPEYWELLKAFNLRRVSDKSD